MQVLVVWQVLAVVTQAGQMVAGLTGVRFGSTTWSDAHVIWRVLDLVAQFGQSHIIWQVLDLVAQCTLGMG